MKNKKKLWWLALPAAVILTIVYLNYEPVFFNRKTIRVNKKTEVHCFQFEDADELDTMNIPLMIKSTNITVTGIRKAKINTGNFLFIFIFKTSYPINNKSNAILTDFSEHHNIY